MSVYVRLWLSNRCCFHSVANSYKCGKLLWNGGCGNIYMCCYTNFSSDIKLFAMNILSDECATFIIATYFFTVEHLPPIVNIYPLWKRFGSYIHIVFTFSPGSFRKGCCRDYIFTSQQTVSQSNNPHSILFKPEVSSQGDHLPPLCTSASRLRSLLTRPLVYACNWFR